MRSSAAPRSGNHKDSAVAAYVALATLARAPIGVQFCRPAWCPAHRAVAPRAGQHVCLRQSEAEAPPSAVMLSRWTCSATSARRTSQRVAPLAVRMRPRTLDEFVGQQHFLGAGQAAPADARGRPADQRHLLRPAGHREDDARAARSRSTRKSHFEQVNAAAVGVKEVRAILDAAKERLGNVGRADRPVPRRDPPLQPRPAGHPAAATWRPGYVILVGATTENPFFAVNSPLISRSQIFQFAPLSEDEIRTLIRRAIADKERGFGNARHHDRRRGARPLGDDERRRRPAGADGAGGRGAVADEGGREDRGRRSDERRAGDTAVLRPDSRSST